MVCHDKVLVKFILVYKLSFESSHFLPFQCQVNENRQVKQSRCRISTTCTTSHSCKERKILKAPVKTPFEQRSLLKQSDEGQQELFALTNIHDKVLINIIIGENWRSYTSPRRGSSLVTKREGCQNSVLITNKILPF